MGMEYLGIGSIVFAFLFFGWCFWVLSPKHPERLDRLRKELGVIEDENSPPDFRPTNKPPRP